MCESCSCVHWQEIDAIEEAIETLREKRQEFKKDFDEQVLLWDSCMLIVRKAVNDHGYG